MALNHDPNLNDALYYQMLAVKQKEEARQAALRTAEATESTISYIQEIENELVTLRLKLENEICSRKRDKKWKYISLGIAILSALITLVGWLFPI